MVRIEETDNRPLFNSLMNIHQAIEGSNNYTANTIDLEEVDGTIYMETLHTNEYGGVYPNCDIQDITESFWQIEFSLYKNILPC